MNLEKLRAQLVLAEEYRLLPYTDTVGKITIGIGHNLTDLGLSPCVVEAIYTEDVQRAISGVTAAFPWWIGLDDVRQRVVIDLTFNMGLRTLQGFPHALAAMARGDWARAAAELQDSHWYRQVGVRGPRLVQMLLTGVDPS